MARKDIWDAPLPTARSIPDSVRDDYSSWLDEIFPPSRPVQEKQHKKQPLTTTRQQDTAVAAQLRKSLPLELPQPITRFASDKSPREDSSSSSKRNWRGSLCLRQPPPQARRSSSLPVPSLDEQHHRHQRLRRCLGTIPAAASKPPMQSRHPATFPDMRYGSRQSSYRPGLNFFEFIPPGAFVSVPCTLVFLGFDAAKRNGGEVLWLRTNAAGKTQRRVFPTVEYVISRPKLRRRVALSLNGREDNGDVAPHNTSTPASAPAVLAALVAGVSAREIGTLHQPHIRPPQQSGTTLAAAFPTPKKGVHHHPAALLKGYRPDNRSSRSSNKHTGNRRGEGGGNTDVWFLHNVSEIEQALAEAGKWTGKSLLAEDKPESNSAQRQQTLHPRPRQPFSHSSSGNGGGLTADSTLGGPFPSTGCAPPRVDGSCQNLNKGGGIKLEAGTPEVTVGPETFSTGDQRGAAQCGELAISSAPGAATGVRSGFALQLEDGVVENGAVRRSRPWAIQKFLMPKGPLAWMVRVVWRRNRDSFCWIISGSDPFVTSGLSNSGGGSAFGGTRTCSAVRSIAGHAGWEVPKAFVACMVETLEVASAETGTEAPLRFDEFVADLIEDREGKWWLIQVKAFRLLRSLDEIPASNTASKAPSSQSSMASLDVLDASRTKSEGRDSGGFCSGPAGNVPNIQPAKHNSEEQDTCRGGGTKLEHCCYVSDKKESDFLPPPESQASASAAQAISAAIDAAVRVPRKSKKEEPPGLVGLHPELLLPSATTLKDRRKSLCPGLYCNSGKKRGGQHQQPKPGSIGMPSALERRENGEHQNGLKEAAVGNEEAGEREMKSMEGWTDNEEIELLGAERENAVGEAGGSTTVEDDPIFQLPLKALVVNDEVARLRRDLLIQEQAVAASTVGAVSDYPTEAVRAKGRDNSFVVEAKALAGLRQRDRALLYDSVSLCGECYRIYGDNWRWWLAQREQSPGIDRKGSGLLPLSHAASGSSRSRSNQERQGRLRTLRRHPSAAELRADTAVKTGAGGAEVPSGTAAAATAMALAEERLARDFSVCSRDASLSLWLSLKERDAGPGATSDNNGNIHNAASTRTLRGNGTARPPTLHEHATMDVSRDAPSTPSLDSAEVPHEERSSRRQGRNGRGAGEAMMPCTSTAEDFRARLDRRLEGISIPAQDRSRKRPECTRRGVEGTIPLVTKPAGPGATQHVAAAAASPPATEDGRTGENDPFAGDLRKASGDAPAEATAATGKLPDGEDTAIEGGKSRSSTWEWENVKIDWRTTTGL